MTKTKEIMKHFNTAKLDYEKPCFTQGGAGKFLAKPKSLPLPPIKKRTILCLVCFQEVSLAEKFLALPPPVCVYKKFQGEISAITIFNW